MNQTAKLAFLNRGIIENTIPVLETFSKVTAGLKSANDDGCWKLFSSKQEAEQHGLLVGSCPHPVAA